MKLRNKQTGEIVEVITGDTFEAGGIQIRSLNRNPQIVHCYSSLADLNEDWEDYEEPKEYYCIDWTTESGVFRTAHEDEMDDFNKQIGNYFSSREEAEKAVEKLKAWKRLRDKGFRFIDHIGRDTGQGITRYEWDGYVNAEDLDLLFGGEE